jgi:hypothetical protein
MRLVAGRLGSFAVLPRPARPWLAKADQGRPGGLDVTIEVGEEFVATLNQEAKAYVPAVRFLASNPRPPMATH